MTILRSTYAAFTAAVYDPFLALGERRGMAAHRRALLAGATGSVLEIGAGTGLNLEAHPPGQHPLVLTEPDPAMARRLERTAARQRPDAVVVRAGAEDLPFADGTFDVVVSTLVLCTVPDPDAAVAELRRVLRPEGRLLYLEHVRSADPRLARRQDRLAPAWRRFAAGCVCNRPTLELLAGAFTLAPPARATWAGMPSIVHPLAIGTAVPRSAGAGRAREVAAVSGRPAPPSTR
ncbi:class I SAM-dependent methyltransferase [Trujillonella endophytica]|uniref:Methyltransferase domain-containing protein n=1 Tax=Trujillonella endophytica TaxID=673521 RepID=A0A1H8Q0R9_9ACTN|nr:class I SAM-dependent methyltransferase [Trujillella endophytica]SEO47825.1 Methyltransferase domain-containing protein [Trujillella endophytica]